MKVAVTGANGQLGRLVIQGLLEKLSPGDIVAVVRNEARAADLAALGLPVRLASYEDVPALEAAFAGVEKVLLVSSNEVGKRIPQHRNAIDAAKSAGVKHVVYTSAPKATTSKLVLAPEHKATEEYLTGSGLDYTVLRNGWYTENFLQVVETAKQTGASRFNPRARGGPARAGPTTQPQQCQCCWARATKARSMSSPATTPGTTTSWPPPSPK